MSITIPINRKRFPILFVISFLLTIGGAYNITRLISEGREQLSSWTYTILAIPLYYCIVSLFDFIKSRFDKNAYLRISKTEINDRLSIFSCGKIAWKDVTDFEVRKSYGVRFLVIKLRDNSKYLARKNFFATYVLNKWIKKWGSPIIISEKRVSYNLEDLKQVLSNYRV